MIFNMILKFPWMQFPPHSKLFKLWQTDVSEHLTSDYDTVVLGEHILNFQHTSVYLLDRDTGGGQGLRLPKFASSVTLLVFMNSKRRGLKRSNILFLKFLQGTGNKGFMQQV